MATNFPGSKHTFSGTIGEAAEKLNSPNHVTHHTNEDDTSEAIQDKLGTGASTPTSKKLLRGTGTGTSAWDKDAPTGAIVGTTDTQTLTNKTLTTPKVDTLNEAGTGNGVNVDGVSHKDNEVILDNDKALSLKESGGTERDGIKLNSSNELEIGGAKQLLGYAEVTSNQGSIISEVDLTNLSVAVTVPELLGRRVKITGYCQIKSTVADDRFGMNIKEGGTELQRTSVGMDVTNQGYSVSLVIYLSPSAGAHTYKLTALKRNGTGTGTMEAGATFPAFIAVEIV